MTKTIKGSGESLHFPDFSVTVKPPRTRPITNDSDLEKTLKGSPKRQLRGSPPRTYPSSDGFNVLASRDIDLSESPQSVGKQGRITPPRTKPGAFGLEETHNDSPERRLRGSPPRTSPIKAATRLSPKTKPRVPVKQAWDMANLDKDSDSDSEHDSVNDKAGSAESVATSAESVATKMVESPTELSNLSDSSVEDPPADHSYLQTLSISLKKIFQVCGEEQLAKDIDGVDLQNENKLFESVQRAKISISTLIEVVKGNQPSRNKIGEISTTLDSFLPKPKAQAGGWVGPEEEGEKHSAAESRKKADTLSRQVNQFVPEYRQFVIDTAKQKIGEIRKKLVGDNGKYKKNEPKKGKKKKDEEFVQDDGYEYVYVLDEGFKNGLRIGILKEIFSKYGSAIFLLNDDEITELRQSINEFLDRNADRLAKLLAAADIADTVDFDRLDPSEKDKAIRKLNHNLSELQSAEQSTFGSLSYQGFSDSEKGKQYLGVVGEKLEKLKAEFEAAKKHAKPIGNAETYGLSSGQDPKPKVKEFFAGNEGFNPVREGLQSVKHKSLRQYVLLLDAFNKIENPFQETVLDQKAQKQLENGKKDFLTARQAIAQKVEQVQKKYDSLVGGLNSENKSELFQILYSEDFSVSPEGRDKKLYSRAKFYDLVYKDRDKKTDARQLIDTCVAVKEDISKFKEQYQALENEFKELKAQTEQRKQQKAAELQQRLKEEAERKRQELADQQRKVINGISSEGQSAALRIVQQEMAEFESMMASFAQKPESQQSQHGRNGLLGHLDHTPRTPEDDKKSQRSTGTTDSSPEDRPKPPFVLPSVPPLNLGALGMGADKKLLTPKPTQSEEQPKGAKKPSGQIPSSPAIIPVVPETLGVPTLKSDKPAITKEEQRKIQEFIRQYGTALFLLDEDDLGKVLSGQTEIASDAIKERLRSQTKRIGEFLGQKESEEVTISNDPASVFAQIAAFEQQEVQTLEHELLFSYVSLVSGVGKVVDPSPFTLKDKDKFNAAQAAAVAAFASLEEKFNDWKAKVKDHAAGNTDSESIDLSYFLFYSREFAENTGPNAKHVHQILFGDKGEYKKTDVRGIIEACIAVNNAIGEFRKCYEAKIPQRNTSAESQPPQSLPNRPSFDEVLAEASRIKDSKKVKTPTPPAASASISALKPTASARSTPIPTSRFRDIEGLGLEGINRNSVSDVPDIKKRDLKHASREKGKTPTLLSLSTSKKVPPVPASPIKQQYSTGSLPESQLNSPLLPLAELDLQSLTGSGPTLPPVPPSSHKSTPASPRTPEGSMGSNPTSPKTYAGNDVIRNFPVVPKLDLSKIGSAFPRTPEGSMGSNPTSPITSGSGREENHEQIVSPTVIPGELGLGDGKGRVFTAEGSRSKKFPVTTTKVFSSSFVVPNPLPAAESNPTSPEVTLSSSTPRPPLAPKLAYTPQPAPRKSPRNSSDSRGRSRSNSSDTIDGADVSLELSRTSSSTERSTPASPRTNAGNEDSVRSPVVPKLNLLGAGSVPAPALLQPERPQTGIPRLNSKSSVTGSNPPPLKLPERASFPTPRPQQSPRIDSSQTQLPSSLDSNRTVSLTAVDVGEFSTPDLTPRPPKAKARIPAPTRTPSVDPASGSGSSTGSRRTPRHPSARPPSAGTNSDDFEPVSIEFTDDFEPVPTGDILPHKSSSYVTLSSASSSQSFLDSGKLPDELSESLDDDFENIPGGNPFVSIPTDLAESFEEVNDADFAPPAFNTNSTPARSQGIALEETIIESLKKLNQGQSLSLRDGGALLNENFRELINEEFHRIKMDVNSKVSQGHSLNEFLEPKKYSGIGINADASYNAETGKWEFLVKTVIPGSPAARSGLNSGEKITISAKNGHSFTGSNDELADIVQCFRGEYSSNVLPFTIDSQAVNDALNLPRSIIQDNNKLYDFSEEKRQYQSASNPFISEAKRIILPSRTVSNASIVEWKNEQGIDTSSSRGSSRGA